MHDSPKGLYKRLPVAINIYLCINKLVTGLEKQQWLICGNHLMCVALFFDQAL